LGGRLYRRLSKCHAGRKEEREKDDTNFQSHSVHSIFKSAEKGGRREGKRKIQQKQITCPRIADFKGAIPELMTLLPVARFRVLLIASRPGLL
jgi:hypothetical protein